MRVIKNGVLVLEDQLIDGYHLVMEGDRIIGIDNKEIDSEAEVFDAEGAYVMPGFIDIHSDYIERMISPRPTVMMDFSWSLKEVERILLGHGITTMYHSLSLYKVETFGSKQIRQLDNALRLIDTIDSYSKQSALLHHRVHARLELDYLSVVDDVLRLIDERKIQLLSFMDHTPGQGQYRDIEIYRKSIGGYHDKTETEIDELIQTRINTALMTEETIRMIAEKALAAKIPLASHDDDTLAKVDLMESMGCTISEFPITLEVAKDAARRGLATVAGAPNVLLGQSHSGNLSALEGISARSIQILCSDYYPSSLVSALFKIKEVCRWQLPEVVKLLTLNPAKALGEDDRLGSLQIGKQADVLIVRHDEGYSSVQMVFVSGNPVFSMGVQR